MSLLTPRDQALFHALGKYGLLTTSQLSKQVFPGVQNSTVLRRLRVLEEEKWIYRIKALESGELVWILSRKGEDKIGVSTPMIRPNRNGIAHDVLLTDFRMSMEAIGLAQNFIPEWSIRRSTFDSKRSKRDELSNVPDGIFSALTWNGKVRTVALELELHAKNMSRYEKVFTKYMNQKSLGLVWYFVKSQSMGHSLRAKWNDLNRYRHHKDETLIFTVMSDFEKSPRQALVHFVNGKADSVEEYFKLPELVSAPDLPAQSVGRQDAAEIQNQILQIAS